MYGGDPQHQQRPPPGPSFPPPPQLQNHHQFHQHHQQQHDFSRGPHPQGPPPHLMRQPSASSTNMNPPPHDYHHHHQHPPGQPPFHGQMPYDAHSDAYGAKRIRKIGQRRAVDYTSTVVQYMQIRMFQRDARDRTVIQPHPVAAIDMLPPVAYSDNPSTGFAAKYVHTSWNKNRCPINQVLWTPSGRRLITGSQSGEFTLWNGQSFNFEMILQAHEKAVRSMIWSYNENWMVTGDDGGSIKYWLPNMNNVKANKLAHKESVRGLSFCRTDLKFCSCSDDTTVKVWDFARCQEERSLSGHGGDVKCVDWHPTKSLLVSGGKDNIVKLWDAKTGKELCSFHGHKNTVLCAKWNQNGNWVLTSSKNQIIKLYDIRAMKELESFRGHKKDVTALAWHPFHEEYFVSGSYDGSIFHWLVGHETPQVEVQNAHDNSVLDLAWHPMGYLLCSGGHDNATKFWCRNRPGDPARDKFSAGNTQASFGEQNPAMGARTNAPFFMPDAPSTPFGPGLARNEGTIPGIGAAMPLVIPSLVSSQGQPPLPPGPHPSLVMGGNPQQQPYQQNAPPGQQHQPLPHQMSSQSLPPPNMPQQQPPNLLLSHSHFPRPQPQIQQHNMPGQMGGMNQMVSQMPQGHFMGMNPSGPPGAIPTGLHNMQAQSNPSGKQMYQPGGGFNRPPQAGQMPMIPGINPYQTGNPNASGMPSGFSLPPPLPPGPPPHGHAHQ